MGFLWSCVASCFKALFVILSLICGLVLGCTRCMNQCLQRYGPGPRKSFFSILITGASSGIGAEFARQYAKDGVRLVLVARRADKLKAVAEECEKRGAVVIVCVGSVVDKEAMETIIVTQDGKCPLDLVIANAGIHASGEDVTQLLTDAVEPTMRINVMGVCNTITPCIPLMKKRGAGQIVIVSSLSGCIALDQPFWMAYAASKTWCNAYGSGLRPCLSSFGVGVTVLCPGFIHSELVDKITEKIESSTISTQQMKEAGMPSAWLVRKTAMETRPAVKEMREGIARNIGIFLLPAWWHILGGTMFHNVRMVY